MYVDKDGQSLKTGSVRSFDSSEIVVVLGSGPVADETVKIAREHGHKVVYGCTDGPSESSIENDRDHHLDIHNYDDFVSTFQRTIDTHHKIDTLILCFSTAQSSNGLYDHQTLDETIYPFIKAVKLIFYYWRRDPRRGKRGERRRVVFLGQYPQGIDTGLQTAYGGILGLYRSTLFRFNVLGIQPEFIAIPHGTNPDLVMDAILGVSTLQRFQYGTVYKLDGNTLISQDPSIGTFTAPQSIRLGTRFIYATWLIERITALAIYTKGMSRTSSTLLTLAVTVLSFMLGYLALVWQSPWLGLFVGLIEARFGAVTLVFGGQR